MPLGRRSTADDALVGLSLSGKTAIVTGGASGIGVETVRALAKAGAQVVLAVRNVGAGEAVAARLRAELPASAGALEVRPLDLGDLGSVRAFVSSWGDRPLQLLINNAGIMATPPGQTAQGFELQVGTNHLGHFALTTGLLPALTRGAPARVVTVSSDLHRQGNGARLVSALEKKPTAYTPFGAYGDSKLGNVLFTRALAKRLPAGVEAFSVHPGVIATNLTRSMHPALAWSWKVLGPLLMKSPQQGAATSVFGATAPSLSGRSGEYLANCAPKTPARDALDDTLAERVWQLSEQALATT